MTLGGLALAVGILVDDATVTIENINWHLEQGKEVETAILDGANQIVTPAFVSLLCICIVFVPMFFLKGVRALSVRADGRSGDVRDDLVVHPVAHAGADDGEISAAAARPHRCTATRRPPPSRNPLVRFQRGFEARFERLRARLSRSADAGAGAPPVFVTGFLAFVVGVSFLLPVSRPQLLSVGRRRPDPDARPHPGRHPRRGDRQSVRRRAEGDPQDHSAGRDRDADRQYRHADHRHQHDLQQHRRDRSAGRRHPDQAERRITRRPTSTSGAARTTAAAVSRHDLLVPAGRHRQPDPEFRRAGADRPADPRRQSDGEFRLRQQAAEPAAHGFPASPMRASSSRPTTRASTSMSTAPARNMSA